MGCESRREGYVSEGGDGSALHGACTRYPCALRSPAQEEGSSARSNAPTHWSLPQALKG